MAATVLVPNVDKPDEAVRVYLKGKDASVVRVTPLEKNSFGWFVAVSKK